MSRWAQGQQTVERLLRERHLQQVVADGDIVTAGEDASHQRRSRSVSEINAGRVCAVW